MTSDKKPSDRRAFLGSMGVAAIAGGTLMSAATSAQAAPVYTFAHGVASGDPLATQVIIWTRVTAQGDTNPKVFWEVATDAAFTRVVRSGLLRTSATQDFTVKVDVTGLQAGTRYHYRFTCGTTRSPVGRTRTLPQGTVEQVRLAVFSCSNYPAGFFHAYAEGARMADIDVAVHLGDFIYEYDRAGYASELAASLGREVLPANECKVLSDYRARHAQYRTDADLQALMASVPMIAVWDDHEIANNTYVSGAANHTEGTEGTFTARRDAAIRAYHEWLPTRVSDPSDPRKIYRSFDFGNLLSLHMLETRVLARTKQLSLATYVDENGINADALNAAVNATSRKLLGDEQLAWLQGRLAASSATWQVLGQQILMARMHMPAAIALGQISIGNMARLTEKAGATPERLSAAERYILGQPVIPDNMDAWDGYAAERESVLATARNLNKNLVVLAGDTHNAWASDLEDAAGQAVGVEFATPGVSSPGMEKSRLTDTPANVARWYTDNVPTLRYAETEHRGFMVLTVTPQSCQSTWYFVDTVSARQYAFFEGETWAAHAGERRLVRA